MHKLNNCPSYAIAQAITGKFGCKFITIISKTNSYDNRYNFVQRFSNHSPIQFNLFSQTQPSAGGLQRKTNWSSNVCCTQSHWNLHRKICRNGLQRWTNKHFKTYTSIYKYDGQVVLYERADNYLHKQIITMTIKLALYCLMPSPSLH